MTTLVENYMESIRILEKRLKAMSDDMLIEYVTSRHHSTSVEKELANRLKGKIPTEASAEAAGGDN